MEQTMELTNRTLTLANTIREGLDCIVALLQELEYQDSVVLLGDAVEGIVAIEKTLFPSLQDLNGSLLENCSDKLHRTLESALACYDIGDMDGAELICSQVLVPVYESWLTEVQRMVVNCFYN